MTTVGVHIKYSPDTIDVSNDVIDRLDIWRKATDGIGRFRVKLKNDSGEFLGSFAADDAILIKIATVDFLKGYLDKGIPKSVDAEDVYKQIFELSGRDYGQDLQNKRVNKTGEWAYKKQPADDIIDNMLSQASSEITFTSPSTATEIAYTDRGNEFLIEAFRKIMERINYDFFVDMDKVFKIFAIGSIDSGIELKCVANAADNNILDLKKVEFDSYELRNYIIATAGKIRDGWTDGNASDFTGLTNNVITNEYTIVHKGTGAIKCAKGSESDCKLMLSFPEYNYTELDFKTFGTEKCNLWCYVTGGAAPEPHVILWLEDSSGNQIFYGWEMEATTKNTWLQRPFPVGSECEILAYADAKPKRWAYGSGFSAFNWDHIVDFWVYASDADTLIIDDLSLPIPMIAYAQDGTSQGLYKVRQWPIPAKGIYTQVELDEFAASELAKRKDPIAGLKIIALGTAGIIESACKWIPGYKVKVNSPGDGINNAYYRILEVHIIVADEPIMSGYDFIAEVSLVPHDAPVSGKRFAYVDNPDVALLRALHDKIRFLEKQEDLLNDWFPAIPAPDAVKMLESIFYIQSLQETDTKATDYSTDSTDYVTVLTMNIPAEAGVKPILKKFECDLHSVPGAPQAYARCRLYYKIDGGAEQLVGTVSTQATTWTHKTYNATVNGELGKSMDLVWKIQTSILNDTCFMRFPSRNMKFISYLTS